MLFGMRPKARKSKDPILSTFHSIAKMAFIRLGMKFERRRSGDTGLGIWRIPLNKELEKTTGPRRIVLVPGFGDSPTTWFYTLLKLQPLLKPHFTELCVLDFPAWNGFLAHEPAIPTMEDLLREISDVLDWIDAECIVAHSLGGWLSAEYAYRVSVGKRPEGRAAGKGPGKRVSKLARLVLIAPAGLYGETSELLEWKGHFDEAMRLGFETYRPRLFHKEPFWYAWIASEFNETMKREDLHSFLKSIRSRHYMPKRVKEIKIPTVVIWGDHDTLSPTKWQDIWVKMIASNGTEAKALTVVDAGHSVQSERPFQVADLIMEAISPLLRPILNKP